MQHMLLGAFGSLLRIDYEIRTAAYRNEVNYKVPCSFSLFLNIKLSYLYINLIIMNQPNISSI